MQNAAPWIRIVIEGRDNKKLTDALSVALQEAGAPGVEVQDSTTLPSTLDPEPPVEGQVRIVAYLEATEGPDAIAALREHIFAIGDNMHGSLTFEVSPFDDTSWRDSWKAFFKPAQISDRVAIRAPWAEFEAAPGVEVLVIEPGMAFGTGLHETTRLCIQALDRRIDDAPPAWLLDVGCGSGVLSIAAVKLGVERVVGVDVDPIAAQVSEENAQVNDVVAQTDFSTRGLDEIPETAPLVVANILAHILKALRDQLIARTAPGGVLILCGVLTDEHEALRDYFCEDGVMTCERTDDMGEWTALELRRAS